MRIWVAAMLVLETAVHWNTHIQNDVGVDASRSEVRPGSNTTAFHNMLYILKTDTRGAPSNKQLAFRGRLSYNN
ncbi:MAG: hypothetical protein COA78_01060 [Blastopirellula sp.]|nr:MAG: hypothetical protein COA78_01060 [Blastopirellula sp.]